MTTDTQDFSHLRGLAEAATSGHWTTKVKQNGWYATHNSNDDTESCPVADVLGTVVALAVSTNGNLSGTFNTAPNAAFIAAANPATVIALLDKLEALQAEVERRGVVLLLAGLYPDCTKEDAKQHFADYEALQAENAMLRQQKEVMRVEIKELESQTDCTDCTDEVMNGLMLEKAHTAMKDQRDAALARLATMEKQKPCAAITYCGLTGDGACKCEDDGAAGCYNLVDLFAAAGASPDPSALQAENDKLITALAACRDAFPVPDAGSRLDDWYCSAMADPLEVPEYVKACVGASPVEPSQEQFCYCNDSISLQSVSGGGSAEGLRRDAERYRWLTDDHPDRETREAVIRIGGSIWCRGKGSTDSSIDAAMEASK